MARSRCTSLALIACTALGSSLTGLAASAQDAAPKEERTTVIKEVVITATRSSQVMSKVPISVSAFSQDKMDQEGVRDFSDIARYTPGVTNVSDDAATVLARGEGVCQDQAHVFIACCRAAGIPARYVSGYFYTGDVGEIASHAWADAWLGEETGWLSIDLTHKSLAGERHCRLAVGRDYRDAAPVRGVRHGGGGEAMHVAVVVAASAQQQ